MRVKHLRLPVSFSLLSLASVATLAALGGLAACSSSSETASAAPGTATPTPDGGEAPEGEGGPGAPDGSVTPPVAPGAVDPSFGTKGVASGTAAATPTIRFSGDGRTVVFEHKTNVYATFTALVANGTLDTTHGKEGLAEVMIPNAMNHSQSLNATARIENDGSVLVSGGMKQENVYYVPFIGRVTGNSLDYTFGNPPGGLWTFPDVYATAGRVLVEHNSAGAATGFYTMVSFSSLGGAGGTTPREASVRVYHLTAAGVTDTAFGGGKGYFELPVIGDLTLDASGLPIVLTSVSGGSLEARRLTKAGALDTTYGSAGVAVIGWAGQTSFGTSSIVAPAKGGLLLALSSGPGAARIVRLDAKGATAEAFPGSPSRDIPDARLQLDELKDGRLLVTSYGISKTTLERWLADGKPDTVFGTAGKVDLATVAGAGVLSAVGVTSTGATMLATTTSTGSSTQWSVRRLGP